MLIGCCVNMLPRTPLAGAEYIPHLAKMGYDYADVPLNQLNLLNEADFMKVTEIIGESGIPVRSCNDFLPREFKIVGPEKILTERSVVLEYLERAFERVGKSGLRVNNVIFGSSRSRFCSEGWPMEEAHAQIREFLEMIAPMAEKSDLLIAIEHINHTETNTLNHFDEAVRIARSVNHPSVRMLCDYYHVRMESDDPEKVLQDGGDLIIHTHIAKRKDRTWFTDIADEEQYVYRYANKLKELNYEGGVSIEAPVDAEHWREMAEKTLPVLKELFQ